MSDNTSFVIDNDLRTIEIPENFVLGVYHDRDVNTIHFIAPRKYKNIDLSQYSIQPSLAMAGHTSMCASGRLTARAMTPTNSIPQYMG